MADDRDALLAAQKPVCWADMSSEDESSGSVHEQHASRIVSSAAPTIRKYPGSSQQVAYRRVSGSQRGAVAASSSGQYQPRGWSGQRGHHQYAESYHRTASEHFSIPTVHHNPRKTPQLSRHQSARNYATEGSGGGQIASSNNSRPHTTSDKSFNIDTGEPYKVFIGKLPLNVTREEIISTFPGVKITNVTIAQHKGYPAQPSNTLFAFVEVATFDDHQRMLTEFDGAFINGNRIVIKLAKRDNQQLRRHQQGGPLPPSSFERSSRPNIPPIHAPPRLLTTPSREVEHGSFSGSAAPQAVAKHPAKFNFMSALVGESKGDEHRNASIFGTGRPRVEPVLPTKPESSASLPDDDEDAAPNQSHQEHHRAAKEPPKDVTIMTRNNSTRQSPPLVNVQRSTYRDHHHTSSYPPRDLHSEALPSNVVTMPPSRTAAPPPPSASAAMVPGRGVTGPMPSQGPSPSPVPTSGLGPTPSHAAAPGLGPSVTGTAAGFVPSAAAPGMTLSSCGAVGGLVQPSVAAGSMVSSSSNVGCGLVPAGSAGGKAYSAGVAGGVSSSGSVGAGMASSGPAGMAAGSVKAASEQSSYTAHSPTPATSEYRSDQQNASQRPSYAAIASGSSSANTVIGQNVLTVMGGRGSRSSGVGRGGVRRAGGGGNKAVASQGIANRKASDSDHTDDFAMFAKNKKRN